ncbi:hypothetical protein FR483_n166R [Paramecium bursaria Chlorella virus FR483]|uniref:Uncharacterized protein n166R n=1 Tax=Paramecium bursaria Chlorella virus FR483 TaxID=399781 RepID=A7J6M0_PBCVF|nr:hypothetical protein FR483_n166R [Paramecium bursaria Chlorella virus FR483]ABT15451.1 hypothetical protein FR483_n166R [Paramecium bursaria Chlorella virus FR483]
MALCKYGHRLIRAAGLHLIIACLAALAFTTRQHPIWHVLRIHARGIRKPQCFSCCCLESIRPFIRTNFPRFCIDKPPDGAVSSFHLVHQIGS